MERVRPACLPAEAVAAVIPEANAQRLKVYGHTLSSLFDASSTCALEQVTVSTIKPEPGGSEQKARQNDWACVLSNIFAAVPTAVLLGRLCGLVHVPLPLRGSHADKRLKYLCELKPCCKLVIPKHYVYDGLAMWLEFEERRKVTRRLTGGTGIVWRGFSYCSASSFEVFLASFLVGFLARLSPQFIFLRRG